MTLTLEQLLKKQTREEFANVMLGVFQSAGFPTTAWQEGDPDRTRIAAFATALEKAQELLTTIVGGGYTDFAAGEWLRFLAQEIFGLAFNPATRTVGTIRLTALLGAGPVVVAARSLIAVFTVSGNRYVNTTGGTIPDGGSVDLTWESEFPNDSTKGLNYNDANSATITLATPIPGVSATNPAGTYSTVGHTGSGGGTLTLTGVPAAPHQVIVRIDGTGQSGVAAWSYSLDGGDFVSAGTVASLSNVGGSGINIALTNHGSLNPSFHAGDTYLFSAPGSWITTQGADIESDHNLQERCRDRWPTLSEVPTRGWYEELATSEPTVGSQVTQVRVVPHATINNRVNVVIAGPAGALPAGTVTAIQAWITPRVRTSDNVVVVTPTTSPVTAAATVTVEAAKLAAASAAISTALRNLVLAMGINGTLKRSEIVETIWDVDGVKDVDLTSVLINNLASNLTLGTSTSFVVPASNPTITLTFVTQ